MTDEPAWLARARRQLGVREVSGPASDSHILAYRDHAKVPIGGALDDGAVPWCAIFVNAMLELVGIRGTRSAMARSFSRYGTTLYAEKPALGCIAVFSSSRGPASGHVGFVIRNLPNHLEVLGGNQGDAVSIAPFPKSRLLSLHWPPGSKPPGLNDRLPIVGGRVGTTVSDA